MGRVRRSILLTLGWEELPKSVSVYGAPVHIRLREPAPGVLLQTDGGRVLLDTGFNTDGRTHFIGGSVAFGLAGRLRSR